MGCSVPRVLVQANSTVPVAEWPDLLDGGDGREVDLVTRDGVEEVELGPPVDGDDPAVGRADEVAAADRRVRESERVRLLLCEAVEARGARAGGRVGVEKARRLRPDPSPELRLVTQGVAGAALGGADAARAEEVWDLESREYRR